MSTNIAVLLTCFNRKEQTLSCLRSLYSALDAYSKDLYLEVFLTDDGCTDGTADVVASAFSDRNIHILKGTGNLYWAGGMRFAWREAMKSVTRWDFYLLLNDDTVVMSNVFDELFAAHSHALSEYGKTGIYSGVTCEPSDHNSISYGGDAYLTAAHTTWKRVIPNGKPQMVDRTNANILLVAAEVVGDIGIFYDGYIHGGADEDYAITARRAGLPVLITGNVCGECAYDHISDKDECQKLMAMSLAERKRYLSNPTHSDHDYLVLMRRIAPRRYIVSWLLRKIRFYAPSLYFKINKHRGIY